MLKEIPLGQAGIAYIKSCLQQGTGLCTRALDLAFSSGEVFAPVPEQTSLDRAKLFEVGGLMSRRDTFQWLAGHFEGPWNPHSNGTLLFQDIWARSTDPTIQNAKIDMCTQDSAVYYFRKRSAINLYWIEEAARALTSYLFVAFYTGLPIRLDQMLPNHAVEEALIDKLAEGIREVFVGAYDQEGIVVWRSLESDS